jgi:hypothetical protein
MAKKPTKTIEVHIPLVPNFIMMGEQRHPTSISKFTEDELKEVGEEWTRKLIERARVIKSNSL